MRGDSVLTPTVLFCTVQSCTIHPCTSPSLAVWKVCQGLGARVTTGVPPARPQPRCILSGGRERDGGPMASQPVKRQMLETLAAQLQDPDPTLSTEDKAEAYVLAYMENGGR